MPVTAVIDKSRLKRWLDPCYFCEIDVASKLTSVFGFKIELLDLVSINHHDAGLFRVGGIDKHFLSHNSKLHSRDLACPGGPARHGICLVRAICDARIGRAAWPLADLLNAVARVIAVLLRYGCTSVASHPFKYCAFWGFWPCNTSAVRQPFPAQSVCRRATLVTARSVCSETCGLPATYYGVVPLNNARRS